MNERAEYLRTGLGEAPAQSVVLAVGRELQVVRVDAAVQLLVEPHPVLDHQWCAPASPIQYRLPAESLIAILALQAPGVAGHRDQVRVKRVHEGTDASQIAGE
jgi:hypothetical protein